MQKTGKSIQLTENVYVVHHGGKNTVTGSCHELMIGQNSILIDCGLFQGEDAGGKRLDIEFSLKKVRALVLTHAHIDHIGRLPWLLAAGFRGLIYCTQATAHLVPLMLEDGLKLQLGLKRYQRTRILDLVSKHLCPVNYGTWIPVKAPSNTYFSYLRFNPAGHILGSAYIEVKLPNHEIAIFSGDLGPSNTPLLPDPAPPKRVDYLFLESTYGDKNHESIATRSERLLTLINKSLQNGGTIIIPAFSVGRTQELLFDIESLLHSHNLNAQLPIIIDSPMAANVTNAYKKYRKLWSKEAKIKHAQGRHPLNFQQHVVINDHREHLKLVNRLASTGEPAIIIASSGMCQGGRVMNYLQALLPDARTDVIFTGYQAKGTLGRALQQSASTVLIDGREITVNASVHTMSGYSAHAGQSDLINFVRGSETKLKQLHLIHGESCSKQALIKEMTSTLPSTKLIS